MFLILAVLVGMKWYSVLSSPYTLALYFVCNVHKGVGMHYTWQNMVYRYYTVLFNQLIYPWYVIIVPVYNAHPYFSLKNLGKKCALYTTKYSESDSHSIKKKSLQILKFL